MASRVGSESIRNLAAMKLRIASGMCLSMAAHILPLSRHQFVRIPFQVVCLVGPLSVFVLVVVGTELAPLVMQLSGHRAARTAIHQEVENYDPFDR